MAINDIFLCCELMELTEGERLQLSDRMDFFYVLKGECWIEYEVTRTLQAEATAQELTREEVEEQRDLQTVSKLGRRLSKILIDPY